MNVNVKLVITMTKNKMILFVKDAIILVYLAFNKKIIALNAHKIQIELKCQSIINVLVWMVPLKCKILYVYNEI